MSNVVLVRQCSKLILACLGTKKGNYGFIKKEHLII